MMQEIRHIKAAAQRRKESRLLDRAEGAGSKLSLYIVALIAAILVLIVAFQQLGMRFDANSPVFLQAARDGALTGYTGMDARGAVALAQLAKHSGLFIACGIAGTLLGAGLAVLTAFKCKKAKGLWLALCVFLTSAGISVLAQGFIGGGIRGDIGAASVANLPALLNINSISAEARLLLWQGALYHTRFALLALGLALLCVAGWGLWRARANLRLSRDAMSIRGYKRTITVFVLVVLLYVFVIVTFLGCFNVLGAFTNAAGLGDALNDYGRRDVAAAQKGVDDAIKDHAKAVQKLDEARAELAQGEAALAAAKDDKAIAAAEKTIKSANKDIEKQEKKIAEAIEEKAQAELDLIAAEPTVTTYAGYSVSDLFTLTERLLPYRAQYGTELDKMYAAFAEEYAQSYGLNAEECTVLARKAGGYNLSRGDLDIMRQRYLIAAIGIIGLVGVIGFARRKHVASLMFRHAFLSLVAFISVFPFYWIVVSATNTSMDITLGKLGPGRNLLVNFVNAAYTGTLKISFANSLRNALVITVLALVVSSAAGYGFVVYRDKGKEVVMKLIMLSMMIPAAATLIPLFKLFSANALNLLNTTWAVVLPGLATAFLIFMFRQGAMSFPKDLIEAARIDGMSEFGIFFKMFMPVMRPTYAAAATVTFMGAWNAYLWPLVALTNSDAQTMPIYIANILEGYVMDFGQIMLAVTISTLPTVIIFFFLQKSFVEGIIGSVKQ